MHNFGDEIFFLKVKHLSYFILHYKIQMKRFLYVLKEIITLFYKTRTVSLANALDLTYKIET